MSDDPALLALLEVQAHDTRLDQLRHHHATLPAREREIVLLRYFKELTQREIAQRVGISQMHVSRLLRRSLERLGAAVGDQSSAAPA